MDRRPLWGLALGACVAALGAGRVAAQEPEPVVVVVVVESVEPATTTFRCGAIDPTFHPGSVTAARSGDTTEALLVDYAVSGPGAFVPNVFSFDAGSRVATIDLAPAYGSDDPIVVSLVHGEGYDLGEPASATLPVDTSGVETGCPPYQPPIVEPRFTG